MPTRWTSGNWSGTVAGGRRRDRRLRQPPRFPGASALFVFPPTWLAEERAHRAVGVVHHPGAERWGNHVPALLGRRCDALCRFDESRALTPLHDVHPTGAEMETHASAD